MAKIRQNCNSDVLMNFVHPKGQEIIAILLSVVIRCNGFADDGNVNGWLSSALLLSGL